MESSKKFDNWFSSSLSAAITFTGAGNVYLASLPTDDEGWLVINPDSSQREVVRFVQTDESKAAGTYVVIERDEDRGLENTTARTHLNLTAVAMNATAQIFHYFDKFIEKIKEGYVEMTTGLGYKVYPFTGFIAGNLVSYNGTSHFDGGSGSPVLSNNKCNFIYLDTDGTLKNHTVSLVGEDPQVFPAGVKRLAKIIVSSNVVTNYQDAREFGASPDGTPVTAPAQDSIASTVEAELGTEVNMRRFSPALIKAAIIALAPLSKLASGTAQIKTDWSENDQRTAESINAENTLLLANQTGLFEAVKSGARLDDTLFTPNRVSTDNGGVLIYTNLTSTIRVLDFVNGQTCSITVTSAFANTDAIGGVAKIGDYIYALLIDDGVEVKVYRWDLDGTNATEMSQSFLGDEFTDAPQMMSDGENLYFSVGGGKVNGYGDATTQLDVSNPSGNTFRYTWSGGTDPNFAANGMAVGDEINIASSELNERNQGLYKVTAVADSYFEVENSSSAEKFTNGDFTTDLAGWSETSWEWDAANGGVAERTSATGYRSLTQIFESITRGRYRLLFDVDAISSNMYGYFYPSVDVPAGNIGSQITTTGTKEIYFDIPPGAENVHIGVSMAPGFGQFVDNLHLQRVGGIVETGKANNTISHSNLKNNFMKVTISGTTLTRDSYIFVETNTPDLDYLAASLDGFFALSVGSQYALRKFSLTDGSQQSSNNLYLSDFRITSIRGRLFLAGGLNDNAYTYFDGQNF